jgi:hypothetical protein
VLSRPTDGGWDTASSDAASSTDGEPHDSFGDANVPPDALDGDAGDGCALRTYPTLSLTAVSGTFVGALAIRAAPGTSDLYVVEHGARIQILRADGSNGGVFLDLTSIAGGAGATSEQGMLGLAFHPDYSTNGLFYVYYAPVGGDSDVLAVGHRSIADPGIADPGVMPILTITGRTTPYHHGGDLAFGPDGLLYVGTGDGDVSANAQDNSTLLGKLLRLRVGPSIATYEWPSTNPFPAGGVNLPEIYAWGLRNPWRFSFDRLTGALFIGDVGDGAIEEVDVDLDGSGGDNYGWNVCEGTHDYDAGSCASLTDHHAPTFEYPHTGGFLGGGNGSITGGVVYRGNEIPSLTGTYLFADEVSSRIGGFRYCGSARDPHVFAELDGVCSNPAAFGEDAAGNVYVACIGAGVMRLGAP